MGTEMRYCLAVISIFLPLVFATHTQAASRSDMNGCYYRNDLATQLLGGPDRRIAACTRIIEGRNEPDYERSKGYFYRGGFYRTKGDMDRAVADYSMAAGHGCGSVHLPRFDVNRNIATIKGINNPKDASTFDYRGHAYHDTGDLDRAIADYSEAIRLDPKPYMFGDRGEAYRDRGDLDHAIADYSECINQGKRPVRAASEPPTVEDRIVANCYCEREALIQKQGDLNHAIADSNEAIRVNPQSDHPFKNRGDVYRAKGELDLAIDDYIEAYHRKWNPPLPFDRSDFEFAVVSLFYLILASIVVTWVIISGVGGAFKIAALIFTALAFVTYLIFARCC